MISNLDLEFHPHTTDLRFTSGGTRPQQQRVLLCWSWMDRLVRAQVPGAQPVGNCLSTGQLGVVISREYQHGVGFSMTLHDSGVVRITQVGNHADTESDGDSGGGDNSGPGSGPNGRGGGVRGGRAARSAVPVVGRGRGRGADGVRGGGNNRGRGSGRGVVGGRDAVVSRRAGGTRQVVLKSK